MNQETQSPNLRRRIITINRKENHCADTPSPYHDQIENQLRSNVTIFSRSFPFVPSNKYLPTAKNVTQKHTLVPSKKDIDYFSLFQRKLSTVKFRRQKILTTVKQHRQQRKSEQLQMKVVAPAKKKYQSKNAGFEYQKFDICVQTLEMMRGLDETDLNAFVLLMQHSQGKRKRRAIERWQAFDRKLIEMGQQHIN